MEFYFFATAPYHWLKLFEAQMQSQIMTLNYKEPNGTPKTQQFYGMLEPVNLYRYVFPKEAEQLVVNTLLDNSSHLVPKSLQWAIQKGIGLRKPVEPFGNFKMPLKTEGIRILPIGIKEDEEGQTSSGVQQELL